jgi:hypothetical protein
VDFAHVIDTRSVRISRRTSLEDCMAKSPDGTAELDVDRDLPTTPEDVEALR